MGDQSKPGGFSRWRREFDAAIEMGLEDVRAGRLVSHEAMLAYRAERRREAGR